MIYDLLTALVFFQCTKGLLA